MWVGGGLVGFSLSVTYTGRSSLIVQFRTPLSRTVLGELTKITSIKDWLMSVMRVGDSIICLRLSSDVISVNDLHSRLVVFSMLQFRSPKMMIGFRILRAWMHVLRFERIFETVKWTIWRTITDTGQ